MPPDLFQSRYSTIADDLLQLSPASRKSRNTRDRPPMFVPVLMLEHEPFPPGGAERNPVEVETAASPQAPAVDTPANCAA